jgi:hypothetical protein
LPAGRRHRHQGFQHRAALAGSIAGNVALWEIMAAVFDR